MFDSYHIRKGSDHKTVTVHEHRAPTDESVKIYKELKTEAEKSLIDAVRVNNTHANIVIHKRFDVLNDRFMYRIIYSLNGIKRTVDVTSDAYDIEIDKIVDLLYNELARDISCALLSSVKTSDFIPYSAKDLVK